MAEIKMNLSEFTSNRGYLRSVSSKLSLKLNKEGGSTTSETINGYIKLISKINQQVTKVSTELNTVNNELDQIQKTFEEMDSQASKAVEQA